jgi:tetratricopeptide (TPR) repeat protein
VARPSPPYLAKNPDEFMLALNPYLLMLLVAALFLLVFGGLGLVRREGLSLQFAVETIILTAVLVGGSWLLQVNLNPFLFLALLYLVTMRSRLTTDLANILVRRGQRDLAFRLYRLCLAWWPDASTRLIVLANRGAAELVSGQPDKAIETLNSVLRPGGNAGPGLKYEAACHYNLGYAYEKTGQDAKAVVEYNNAIDAMPGSLYAQAAQAALKRRSKKGTGE